MQKTPASRNRFFKTYTHFVHLSKFTLSIMIIVLLVFMVVIPLLRDEQDGVRVAFESVDSEEDLSPVMVSPRFQGVDDHNQPYLVTADTARQIDEKTIILDNVKADISTKNKSWLFLQAQQGTMKMMEEFLFLQGDVQIYHNAGHEMHTEQIRVNLNNLNTFGETPVQIQGTFGHVKADSFTLLDKGNRMLFNNNVYMLLLP